jgi:hypothetical protein
MGKPGPGQPAEGSSSPRDGFEWVLEELFGALMTVALIAIGVAGLIGLVALYEAEPWVAVTLVALLVMTVAAGIASWGSGGESARSGVVRFARGVTYLLVALLVASILFMGPELLWDALTRAMDQFFHLWS